MERWKKGDVGMTIEQAIEDLDMLFSDSTDEDYPMTEQFANAVRLGVEALEKQRPKKPISYDASSDFIYYYSPSWRCICKSDVSKGSKYCCDCGQKLDWE